MSYLNFVCSLFHSNCVYPPRTIDATHTFSLLLSTVHPSSRSTLLETVGNISGPWTIGLSPRTRLILQDLKVGAVGCKQANIVILLTELVLKGSD